MSDAARNAESAQEIVDWVFDTGGRDARERIWAHAFSQGLARGSLTRRQAVGFLYNWCAVVAELNAASALYLYRFGYLSDRVPDLIPYFAGKLIEEWCEPGLGGHQRTLERLLDQLGGRLPDRRPPRLIPEMRGFVDALVCFMAAEPIDSSPILVEEWFGDWAGLWIQYLERQRIEAGEDNYWRLHQVADGVAGSTGGHRQGNRDFATSVLMAGLGPARPRVVWTRNARTSTGAFVRALDGCMARFGGSNSLHRLDFTLSGPCSTRARTARAARARSMRAIEDGSIEDWVMGPLLLNWRFLHQRLTLSFARLRYRFLDVEDEPWARCFVERFRDEFSDRARDAALHAAAVACATPTTMVGDPWILPETFMLGGFVERLHGEGDLGDIEALPLAPLFRELGRAAARYFVRRGRVDVGADLTRLFVNADVGGALGTAHRPVTAPRHARSRGWRRWSTAYLVDVTAALFEMWVRGCLEHFGGHSLVEAHA